MKKIIITFLSISILFLIIFGLRSQYAPQLIGSKIYNLTLKKKVIALTFDDGPSPFSTNKILQLLKKYNAKATFFVIGKEVEKYPNIAKSIIKNGHNLANHSLDHSRLIFKSFDFIQNQITTTDNIIKDLGYKKEIYFRAPFGNQFLILPYMLKKYKKKHIHWDIILNDWENPPVSVMLNKFEKKLKPGSIVVLHDGYNREKTISLTSIILEKYTKKGYKFVTINELLKNQIID